MYIYICIYMYLYIYMYVHIYIHMYVYIYIHIDIYVYIYMYARMYIYIYIYIYRYVYVNEFVYAYEYVYGYVYVYVNVYVRLCGSPCVYVYVYMHKYIRIDICMLYIQRTYFGPLRASGKGHWPVEQRVSTLSGSDKHIIAPPWKQNGATSTADRHGTAPADVSSWPLRPSPPSWSEHCGESAASQSRSGIGHTGCCCAWPRQTCTWSGNV